MLPFGHFSHHKPVDRLLGERHEGIVEILEDASFGGVELGLGVPAVSDFHDPPLVVMLPIVWRKDVGQCKRSKNNDLWADLSVFERQIMEV